MLTLARAAASTEPEPRGLRLSGCWAALMWQKQQELWGRVSTLPLTSNESLGNLLSRNPFYSLSNGEANGLSPEGQTCPAWHTGALGHYRYYYHQCTCWGGRALLSLHSRWLEIHPPGPQEALKQYSAHGDVYTPPGTTGISCVTWLPTPFHQSRGVQPSHCQCSEPSQPVREL